MRGVEAHRDPVGAAGDRPEIGRFVEPGEQTRIDRNGRAALLAGLQSDPPAISEGAGRL
jgi:hypothetical protein